MVDVGFGMIALRIVNTQQDGSEAAETSETPDVNTEETNTAEVQAETEMAVTEMAVTEMANTEEVQAEEVANTEESMVSECYLGFDSFGRPGCYGSTVNNIATKFTLIPLL